MTRPAPALNMPDERPASFQGQVIVNLGTGERLCVCGRCAACEHRLGIDAGDPLGLAPKAAPLVRCHSCGGTLTHNGWCWAHAKVDTFPHKTHVAEPKPRDLTRWRKWRNER